MVVEELDLLVLAYFFVVVIVVLTLSPLADVPLVVGGVACFLCLL